MASARSCEAADFCSEFAGVRDVSFFRVYEGCPESRLIAESDGMHLIADLSPLVVGHMLMLPAEHHLSFATLTHERLRTVNRILSWLKPAYIRTFGQFAIVEHGSSDDLDHNACITHAHWHVVPFDATQLSRIIITDGLRPIGISRLTDLAGPPWSASSYFFVSDADRHVLFEPLAGQPKQYLRSVMGRALSMADPEWDYAVVVRKELLRETMLRTESWRTR
jgi:diadenosine tetraphosphate (Ap4A) HIT family hydrolase